MKEMYCLFLIFLFSFSTGPAQQSALTQKEKIHQLAIEGIDLIYDMQFEKALGKFDEIVKLEPDNPKGYFLRSAVYYWMFMVDISTASRNENNEQKFIELSFAAIEIAEEKLGENKQDIDAMFYLGGAYGNLGRYYGQSNESMLKAYWYGRKGRNYLEDVVKKNPDYYDAYLGLGIYHYYMDMLPRFFKALSFLLGIEGNRKKGLDELNIAVENGIYTKDEAMFF